MKSKALFLVLCMLAMGQGDMAKNVIHQKTKPAATPAYTMNIPGPLFIINL